MTFQDACKKARDQSQNGYVQHVNATLRQVRHQPAMRCLYNSSLNTWEVDQSAWTISDWRDGTTCVSYSNGREL